MIVRLLEEGDVAAYIALRKASLFEQPLVFAASPEDDFASDVASLRAQIARAPDWVVLCAWDEKLVGAAGLIRERHVKASHKMTLWGMYVAPETRRRGIGEALVAAAIRHASSVPGVTAIQLGVTSAAPAARRLYERAGFRAWGTEPRALQFGGTSVDETRMTLALDEPRTR